MNKQTMQALLMRNALPNMPKVACRRMPVQDMHFRIQAPQKTGEPFKFSGYAVKWDSVNSHGEQFLRGAFADVVAAIAAGTKKVHMYYVHGWRYFWVDSRIAMRVGKWTGITEDETGLFVEGELTPGLGLSDDVAAMLAHETIDGLSIAFFPPNPIDTEELKDRIIIKRADIYEISICDEPSDRDARIFSDAEIDAIEDDAGAVDAMRSMGIPDAYATKLINRISKFKVAGSPQQQPQDDPLAFLDDMPG